VRGYLDGSGWKDYQATGTVCGVELPSGLKRGDRLPEPIFTPATKAEEGHDENISFEGACGHAEGVASEAGMSGGELMERLRRKSIEIYTAAHAYATTRGLMLADTKFEFGLPLDEDGAVLHGSEPIIADEALTPDSSRYWGAAKWEPGQAQESFDKQFVREYLQSLVDRGEWDKTPVGDTGLGPALPPDVVAGTRLRYEEALRRLWGV
jgi:phosphoribosylaminoimidazole-succinocarboxamide synthase